MDEDNASTLDIAPVGRHKQVKLLGLADLDQRTGAAKSARALIQAIEEDLGGSDRLTAGERVLAARAGVAAAMCEHQEALWLSGRPVDIASYATLINATARLLRTIGLERRPRDVTPDLQAYVEAKATEPEVLPPPPAPKAVPP